MLILQLAETLLAKETLNYEDVERLIGPPPFGRKRLIEPVEFEMSLKNTPEKPGPPSSKDNPKQSKEVTDKIINE